MEEQLMTLYEIIPSIHNEIPTFVYSIESKENEDIIYIYDVTTLKKCQTNNIKEYKDVKGEIKTSIGDDSLYRPKKYIGRIYIHVKTDESEILFWNANKGIFIDTDDKEVNNVNSNKLYECKIPLCFESNGEDVLEELVPYDLPYPERNQPYEKNLNTIQSPSWTPKSPNISENTYLEEIYSKKIPLDPEGYDAVLTALIQRLYQIKDVYQPTSIKWYNNVINCIDSKTLINNEEKIESCILEPLLQPFAGSYRNKIRTLLFKMKDGTEYFKYIDMSNYPLDSDLKFPMEINIKQVIKIIKENKKFK